ARTHLRHSGRPAAGRLRCIRQHGRGAGPGRLAAAGLEYRVPGLRRRAPAPAARPARRARPGGRGAWAPVLRPGRPGPRGEAVARDLATRCARPADWSYACRKADPDAARALRRDLDAPRPGRRTALEDPT